MSTIILRAAILSAMVGCAGSAASPSAPPPSTVPVSTVATTTEASGVVVERRDAEAPASAASASSAPTTPSPDDAIVANANSKLVACYATGLKTNKAMAGDVVFRVLVASDGNVAVAVASSSGIAPAVAACMADHLRRLRLTTSRSLPFHCENSAYDGPLVWDPTKPRDPGY